MATKQARWHRFFSSSDTYDPDRRLAFYQQKLRQYLSDRGLCRFSGYICSRRVNARQTEISSLPMWLEEGERYKFGEVTRRERYSRLHALKRLTPLLPMQSGDFYDAKQVEDTVETSFRNRRPLFGYAFADVRPQFEPETKKTLTMSITSSRLPKRHRGLCRTD